MAIVCLPMLQPQCTRRAHGCTNPSNSFYCFISMDGELEISHRFLSNWHEIRKIPFGSISPNWAEIGTNTWAQPLNGSPTGHRIWMKNARPRVSLCVCVPGSRASFPAKNLGFFYNVTGDAHTWPRRTIEIVELFNTWPYTGRKQRMKETKSKCLLTHLSCRCKSFESFY